jgi:pimeloyl-ACP methyl ester carboxylesterase
VDDPAHASADPPPRLGRRLGWWVRDYAYAAVWQLRATFGRSDAATFRSGTRTPVVVLPGVYETWRFLRPLATALHERGHPVHVLDALRHGRRPVADMAASVADYLQANDLRDIVIAAHSKGGLVGKQVMLGAAGERVRGMVAVATPFGGSRYARFMLDPTLRIFSPRSRTILELSRHAEVDARIVSVFGRFDPHIPEGSVLPGARNVLLDTGGHFRILAHPRVMAEIIALAERE